MRTSARPRSRPSVRRAVVVDLPGSISRFGKTSDDSNIKESIFESAGKPLFSACTGLHLHLRTKPVSVCARIRRVTNRQLHAPPELHVKVLGQMEVKDCGCEHCANCSEYLAPREHYEDYEVLGNLWDGTSGKCCDVHRDRRSTKPWPLTISKLGHGVVNVAPHMGLNHPKTT